MGQPKSPTLSVHTRCVEGGLICGGVVAAAAVRVLLHSCVCEGVCIV